MQSCNLMCLPENYQMKVSSTLLGTFCTDDSMVAGMSLAVWNLFKDYFFSLFLSHFAVKKFSACLQHNSVIAVYTTIAGALQICPSVLWFPFCYICRRHVFFLFFAFSNTCCSSSVRINLKYKSGAACSIISITSCHGHSCSMLQRITTKRLLDMCWQKCKLPTTSLIWWFMRLCFEGGKCDVFRTESILWFEAEKIRGTSLQNLSLVLLHVSGTNREEESTECHGHITSLAVLRTHRKLGLATKLMNAARK